MEILYLRCKKYIVYNINMTHMKNEKNKKKKTSSETLDVSLPSYNRASIPQPPPKMKNKIREIEIFETSKQKRIKKRG